MLTTRTVVSTIEPRRFRQLFNACANGPKQFLADRTMRFCSISIEMAATVSAGIATTRRVLGIARPSPACRLVRRVTSNFDIGERRRQSRLNSVRACGWSGAVGELVGIDGGVVSGVMNLESSGVEASDWRPRHDERYH